MKETAHMPCAVRILFEVFHNVRARQSHSRHSILESSSYHLKYLLEIVAQLWDYNYLPIIYLFTAIPATASLFPIAKLQTRDRHSPNVPYPKRRKTKRKRLITPPWIGQTYSSYTNGGMWRDGAIFDRFETPAC